MKKTALVVLASLLTVTAALVLVGCGDPVVGDWEATGDTNCGNAVDKVTFTIDGDLTGQGKVCNCTFTIKLTAGTVEGNYSANVDFGSGCLLLQDGTYSCTLNADDSQLNCGVLGVYQTAASAP